VTISRFVHPCSTSRTKGCGRRGAEPRRFRLQGRRPFVCPAVTEILCRRRRHSPNNDPRRSKRLAKTSKEKRKMVSGDSSPSRADGASRRPPKKNKLVHAHDESASTVPMGTATATWEKKPAALVFHDFNFGGDNQVSDALRAGLSEHCATGLRFVDRKQLVGTDAKLDQNRLQFSRKSPISRLFTPAELARALEL
jgi:hypothetical protein